MSSISADKVSKRGQVANQVTDEEEESAAPPANPQFFLYFVILYLMVTLLTCLLAISPSVFHNNNQKESPFHAHGGFFVFVTIGSVSVFVTTSMVLIFTSSCFQTWMKDVHYTVLKSIGCFSAILAPFSFAAVLFLPSKLNWILISVICLIFLGILVAYRFLWKYVCAHRQDKHSNDFPVHPAGFLIPLVPLSVVLQSFVPPNLYPIYCIMILLIFTYAVSAIAYKKFINNSEIKKFKYATLLDHVK